MPQQKAGLLNSLGLGPYTSDNAKILECDQYNTKLYIFYKDTL